MKLEWMAEVIPGSFKYTILKIWVAILRAVNVSIFIILAVSTRNLMIADLATYITNTKNGGFI